MLNSGPIFEDPRPNKKKKKNNDDDDDKRVAICDQSLIQKLSGIFIFIIIIFNGVILTLIEI